MKFTVVIATCDRPLRLARGLKALEEAIAVSGEGHRIVVADNGPQHTAAGVVESFAERSFVPVEYLQTAPRDKSQALNAGIRAAETDWLAFTDDDTLPDANWLKNAAEYAERTGLRVFAGRIVPGPPDKRLPRWLTPGRSGRVPRAGVLVDYAPMPASGVLDNEMPVPFGANVFVRRAVFEEHGYYDEYLWSLCGKKALGVEDGEFGVRIRSRGEPIGYSHEAVVVHPVHHDRCRLWIQIRIAYAYGWREPFVFFDAARPAIQPYLLRLAAVYLFRAAADLFRRDYAGAADGLVEAARCKGAILGRLSPKYRWRARQIAEAARRKEAEKPSRPEK